MSTDSNFQDFHLDEANDDLFYQGKVLELTPKALSVLRYLINSKGCLVSKNELLDAIWPGLVVGDAALQVCIAEIRKGLKDNPGCPRFIQTVHRKGYRFIGEVNASTEKASPADSPYGNTLLVDQEVPIGRQAILDQLQEEFRKVALGARQLVFVTGDPGIGKTTLVNAFSAAIKTSKQAFIGYGQCVDHNGPAEAFLPILDALTKLCKGRNKDALIALLSQFAPTWLLQMPGLVHTDRYWELSKEIGEVSPERMLREMADALDAISQMSPMVLVLEDLHWADSATINLLDFLSRRQESARLLIIATYRPVEIIAGQHPLRRLVQSLRGHHGNLQLSLELLSREDINTYLNRNFPGCYFESEFVEVVHRQTNGNPLYIKSYVSQLCQEGYLSKHSEGWRICGDPRGIDSPDNLRELIVQQLQSLEEDDQNLLKVMSAVGIRAGTTITAAACGLDPVDVDERCDRLARQSYFLRFSHIDELPGAEISTCYEFSHALYHDVIYHQLSPPRRIRLHRKIAQSIEATYAPKIDEQSVVLAAHFSQAHDYDRAIEHWRLAAERSVKRYAYFEAVEYIEHAHDLLSHILDQTRRLQLELALQMALGPILIAIEGNTAPVVEKVYRRAQELCDRLDDSSHLFPALFGLRSYYQFSDQLQTAHAYSLKLQALAEQIGDEGLLLESFVALSSTHFFLGELAASCEFSRKGTALYNADRHSEHVSLFGTDPGVFCHSRYAQASWLLGYPDRALTQIGKAMALGRNINHPYSLVFAIHNATQIFLYRLESKKALASADEGKAIAHKYKFSFLSCWSLYLRAWALAMIGDKEKALAELEQALAAKKPESETVQGYLQIYVVEIYLHLKMPEQGITLLDKLGFNDKEYSYLGPGEHLRLRGEFLIMQDQLEAADKYLSKAVELNAAMQYRSFQLRSALSLARLRKRRGKTNGAIATLKTLYANFEEGHDTIDQVQACKFLEENS